MATKEFTSNQLRRAANILDNAGQVLLATLVIGPLINVELRNKSVILLGVIGMFIVWWISLYIERKVK